VLLRDPVRLVQLRRVDVALRLAMRAEQQNPGETPVQGACPIGKEYEEPDATDVVAGNAIVGVRKVDGGDGVTVAEGEKGGLGQEEGG
jgi:hypothetical protein